MFFSCSLVVIVVIVWWTDRESSCCTVRVVAGWERPLELLRLWNTLKDQVSYTASYSLKDDPGDPLASLSKSSYLEEEEDEDKDPINPWELYDLKDELKDFGSELRPPLKNGLETDFYLGGDLRYNLDDPPLSRSLDDSDDLMAVSSDGEGDSPYTGHQHHPGHHLVRSFFDRNGLSRQNRSARQLATAWNPGVNGQSGSSSFVRGRSKTSSLPVKAQEVPQVALQRPKENYPPDSRSHRFNTEHRKRILPAHNVENGSSYINGHTYKYNNLQDFGAVKESYRERMKRNKNLSPVIRKKQKYRSAEYKQGTKRGYKTGGGAKDNPGSPDQGQPASRFQPHINQSDIRRLLQDHFSSKASQMDPVADVYQNGTHPLGAHPNHIPGSVADHTRNSQLLSQLQPCVVDHDGRVRARDDTVMSRRDGLYGTNYSPQHQRQPQPPVQSQGVEQRSPGVKPQASRGQRSGPFGRVRQRGLRGSARHARDPRGPTAARDALESQAPRPYSQGQGLPTSAERPSRRTATHRTVHRRSYSDPLYEYLKEDARAYTLRHPPRHRRHSGESLALR